MTALADKKILLGITGGIAACKSAELVRLLIKAGAEVRVVMTPAAREFVQPLTFQASGDAGPGRMLEPEQLLNLMPGIGRTNTLFPYSIEKRKILTPPPGHGRCLRRRGVSGYGLVHACFTLGKGHPAAGSGTKRPGGHALIAEAYRKWRDSN